MVERVKYCLIKNNSTYILRKLDSDDISNYDIVDSLYEIFIYLFNKYDNLSFFDIFKIFTLNEIDFNKSDFIKYFIEY